MLWYAKLASLGLLCCTLLGGSAWYFDALPQRSRPCEPGEDPRTSQCWEESEEIDWSDPSLAPLGANETIAELRWYKGRLGHPVARFFGGHHSTLIATGSSGAKVRIEKFGLGTVEYCPTSQKTRCNLQPGTLYKAAGGRYLNHITWGELHKSMMFDLDHYDLVDANCHHAVQRTWNSAVIPAVQDHSPAPDDSVVAYWHDFLHWFHGTEDSEATGPALTYKKVNLTVQSRRLDSSDATGSESHSHTTGSQSSDASFDGYNVRRRRRSHNSVAERCRGSKPGEGERRNNCPHRESYLSQGSSNGAGTSKKEFEQSGSKRSRMLLSFPLWKDKDCSGRYDSFFQRAVSCGIDNDYSGSMHKRKQVSRPSSQQQSSEEISDQEILPMDPARVRSDSKGADASSVSQCEIGHSQAARSKDDDANACNPLLEGATSSSTADFICQWTCDSGELTFKTQSSSKFRCKQDSPDEFEIGLSPGNTKKDCLDRCASGGCDHECVKKCDYLGSAAMDAGLAVCMLGSEQTSSMKPLEKTEMSATEIVALIGWSILCCCCTCCGAGSQKKKDDQAASSIETQ